MKRLIGKKWFCLLSSISLLGVPAVVAANGGGHGHADAPELEVEIDLFRIGDSISNVGNAQTDASGVRLESQYEINNKIFSLGFERWNYSWTNPGSLPFTAGTASDPWNTFNTIQLGFAYEHEVSKHLELLYYLEAESSFEKEMDSSREYEAGIDFSYTPSDNWTYTLNVNLESLDAESEGAELGVDLEIEWNHHANEGWSGEFEISSEFPETTLRYHFTKAFSTAAFFSEGGTNTIRLSDSSPVIGMQGGYLEDEYNSIGMKFEYELAHESYFSFSLQQNSDRTLTFTDRAGLTETTYGFGDSVEMSFQFSQEF